MEKHGSLRVECFCCVLRLKAFVEFMKMVLNLFWYKMTVAILDFKTEEEDDTQTHVSLNY